MNAEDQAAERLTNDQGEVAVLYSPGFGAGWFSWNQDTPQCLHDGDVARAVHSGDRRLAESLANEKWPDGYWGGAGDLRIEWMSPGTAFRVDEYDGSEGIVYADHQAWQIVPAPRSP